MSKFIVLEGLDGSGKSTIMAMLKKDFPEVVYSREPGGCEFSERIREVIVDERSKYVHPQPMLLAFATSRSANVHELIVPALSSGKGYITDRFDASTYAYQLFGQENRQFEEMFWRVRNDVLDLGGVHLRPSYIYLRLDAATAKSRRAQRAFAHHYHTQTDEYHERVYQGYEEFFYQIETLSQEDCPSENHPHVVDASRSVEEVCNEVKKIVSVLFGVDAR